jgi:hypothetical protein
MENPVAEIPGVIHRLCTEPPYVQQRTIQNYFMPDAALIHPFCRTGSFDKELTLPFFGSVYMNSRWVIGKIYHWYKILSPKVDLMVTSVAFDEENLILYVNVQQTFRLVWLWPIYHPAHVSLVTVLKLVHVSGEFEHLSADRSTSPTYAAVADPDHDTKPNRYLIASQDDRYQTSEFVKFFGLRWIHWMMLAWQYFAMVFCIIGASIGRPLIWYLDGGDVELRQMVSEKRHTLVNGDRDRH